MGGMLCVWLNDVYYMQHIIILSSVEYLLIYSWWWWWWWWLLYDAKLFISALSWLYINNKSSRNPCLLFTYLFVT